MGLDIMTPNGLQEGSFQPALKPADAVCAEAAFRAWCMSDGVIFYGTETPEGGLEIVRGAETVVRDRLAVVARHGYSKGLLLVPGVPEAKSQGAGLIALQEWVNWCANCEAREPGTSLDWNRKLQERA